MDVNKIAAVVRQSLDMLNRGAKRADIDVGADITLSTYWVADTIVRVDIKSKLPLRGNCDEVQVSSLW